MTDRNIQPNQAGAKPLLWPFSSLAAIAALAVLLILSLILFRLVPSIDIAVSRLFFAASACPGDAAAGAVCGAFPASAVPAIGVVREFFHVLPVTIAVLLAIVVAVRLSRGVPASERFNAGALAAISSQLVASLLIVNLVFKEFWGRPRPVLTDIFGGKFPFVPAGEISHHCATNCSFVSGEATGAFWLIGAAALVPSPWRTPTLAVALLTALFISMLRVSFGAHYLSDVTIAGLLSLLVFSVVAWCAGRITSGRHRWGNPPPSY